MSFLLEGPHGLTPAIRIEFWQVVCSDVYGIWTGKRQRAVSRGLQRGSTSSAVDMVRGKK